MKKKAYAAGPLAILLLGACHFLGCGNSATQAHQQRFVMVNAGDKIFLVRSDTGSVWHYDKFQHLFLPVPVEGAPSSVLSGNEYEEWRKKSQSLAHDLSTRPIGG